MNILFVLYNTYGCNSSIHVHGFAKSMLECGCKVTVAIPADKKSVKHLYETPLYPVLTFQEVLNSSIIDDIDIIHAWTPRECVRKFCLKVCEKQKKIKLIVHLEDNEEAILMNAFGVDSISDFADDCVIPMHLSHPVKYKEFLNGCDGVTVLIDTLFEFVPPNITKETIWPIIPQNFFDKKVDKNKLREKYGLSKNCFVISYTGNVHSSNRYEVRSLYLAVTIAYREGMDIRLLRTGEDYVDFYEDKSRWDLSPFLELGFVDYSEVADILAISNLLVQPGNSSVFNDYRLPSKLPEFFCAAKPVALPDSNLAKYLRNGEDAIIMSKGNALDILNAIIKIRHNPQLAKKLSKNGKEFQVENFGKSNQIKLYDFYTNITGNK
jgi:glycosyltransferase involved in cell wall biosynthesis